MFGRLPDGIHFERLSQLVEFGHVAAREIHNDAAARRRRPQETLGRQTGEWLPAAVRGCCPTGARSKLPIERRPGPVRRRESCPGGTNRPFRHGSTARYLLFSSPPVDRVPTCSIQSFPSPTQEAGKVRRIIRTKDAFSVDFCRCRKECSPCACLRIPLWLITIVWSFAVSLRLRRPPVPSPASSPIPAGLLAERRNDRRKHRHGREVTRPTSNASGDYIFRNAAGGRVRLSARLPASNGTRPATW